MNKTAKTVLGLVVLAVVLVGLYAFSRQDKSDTSSGGKDVAGGTYKIGVLGPFTGDAAVYGEPLRKVTELAIEEINNAGGVNGKKMEAVFEDAKCNGKDAANAMQKLVNVDQVKIVLGGFCSSESLAAIPIAETNSVALFSASSSSPDLTGKSRFFSRDYPSDASQGSVLAEVAYNKEGFRKVGFLQEQLDYPLGIYKAFAEKFQSLGGQVTKQEFPKDAVDFRTQLTKLRGENLDALFVDTQAPAASERILKQMKDLNWKPRLMVADIVPGDPTTVENNKDVLEGALAAEFVPSASNSKLQHLLESYKNRNGTDMPYHGYSSTEYDAVMIVRDAIMAVGYDGAKIADWLRTVKNWAGASGSVTIGSNGDRVGGHAPEIITGGKVLPYTK